MGKIIIKGIFFLLLIIVVAIGISTIGSIAHELAHVHDLKGTDATINQICFVGQADVSEGIFKTGGWVRYEADDEIFSSEIKAHAIQFGVVLGIVITLLVLWTIIIFKK